LNLTPLFILGTTSVSLAALLRRACYRAMGRQFTFQLSIRPDHKLITWGPYAIVRHPSYVGTFAVFAGVFMTNMAKGSWIRESGVLETTAGKVAVSFGIAGMLHTVYALLSRAPVEDRLMKKEFGSEWDAWAEKVPWRVIPGIF